MKVAFISFVLVTVGILGCGTPSSYVKIDFDDLSTLTAVTTSNPNPHPVNPGDTYGFGDVITEGNSGAKIVVLPFQWPPRAPNPPQWTTDGLVEIVSGNKAGGTGNELHFNNACLGVMVPPGQEIDEVVVKFADLGGNINLMENGVIHNENNFASIASPTPQGLVLAISPIGGTVGTLELSGTMSSFFFPGPIPPALQGTNTPLSCVIGGGQELWVDDLYIFPKP